MDDDEGNREKGDAPPQTGADALDGRPQWRMPQVDGRRDKPIHERNAVEARI